MAIKAIIFDIDGVLADSRDAVVFNTKTLLREYKFPVLDSDVEKMSSAHSAESVLIALVPALSHNKKLRGEMLFRLSKITNDNLHIVRPTLLTHAVPDLAKSYKLAAASNRKASAKMVLEQLHIDSYFQTISTSADAPPKPDPAMIKNALNSLGVKPFEAIFVGDNIEDVQAGEAAGVRTFRVDGLNKKEVAEFEKMLASL